MKFPEVRLASYVATVFIMLLAVDGSSARAATSSAPQSTTTAAKGWGGLGAFFSVSNFPLPVPTC